MSQSGGDIDLTGKDSESDSLGLKVEPWLETMVIPVGPEPIALFYSNSQFLIFEEEGMNFKLFKFYNVYLFVRNKFFSSVLLTHMFYIPIWSSLHVSVLFFFFFF